MSKLTSFSTPAGPALLHRSDRSTLAISVLPDGKLELVAPHNSSESDINAKVGKRLRWIAQQRANFADMNRNRLPLRYESGATHRYLGRQYRLKIETGTPTDVKLKGGFLRICIPNKAEAESALKSWYRKQAQRQFAARLEPWKPWIARRRLPKPKLVIRKMPKRWGSAHLDGRIFLNPELITAPSICVDYVIAHEVCHLVHPQHDAAFYILLAQVFPNWKQIKARLEQLD